MAIFMALAERSHVISAFRTEVAPATATFKCCNRGRQNQNQTQTQSKITQEKKVY